MDVVFECERDQAKMFMARRSGEMLIGQLYLGG